MESSSSDSFGASPSPSRSAAIIDANAAEGLEPPGAGAALSRRRRQAGDHSPSTRTRAPSPGSSSSRAKEERALRGDISRSTTSSRTRSSRSSSGCPGSASPTIFGGRERELQVIVDPAEAGRAPGDAGASSPPPSSGRTQLQRRRLRRGQAPLRGPHGGRVPLARGRRGHRRGDGPGGVPVYLRDVARARLGYRKPLSRGYVQGPGGDGRQRHPGARLQRPRGDGGLKEATVAGLNASCWRPAVWS